VEKLSLVLWRERELLETLQYRLEVEQLVMANGRTRWLANAARDVESVLEEIRGTEILRSVAADEAAAELGLPPNPSLSSLIDRVAEPWQSIMIDHRTAFRAASEEVSRLADANRTLITAGTRAAREALLGLGGELYTPDGTTVVGTARSARLDRSL
jgi:flagellar FlgN protein